MESLVGYGSDDEADDLVCVKKQSSSQVDVNYEEVQMDLSEESNDSTKTDARRHAADAHARHRASPKVRESPDREQHRRPPGDHKFKHERYSPKSQEAKKEDRYSKDKNRDRSKSRDEKPRDDRSREYRKDRYRDDKGKSKDDRSKDRKSKDDDRGRDSRSYDSRDNGKDERRHRGSSRERHRSRSPRRSEYRSKRSSSRDRGHSGYPKRYNSNSNKMDRLEKLGVYINASNSGYGNSSGGDKELEKDRFYMPGITGRFTEQIQRRKMLWQKKDKIGESSSDTTAVAAPQSTKIWQNTTFAQDTDGKVANKFKRLMGIRGDDQNATKVGNDSLRKQEEMFNSMEAQYEVARTATHTMRGVGLGFGSFQR